jgi:hypothetical protein
MQASDSTYVYVYFYPDIQFNETVFGIEFNLKPFYIGVGVKNRGQVAAPHCQRATVAKQ